ncbi:putative pentatricopeptide repeat-containing protein At1g17630 [Aristolochia californica]|uniref:putative pentatricopeptide repeat-containing protein At1g17630 n=1 Tax=Aristolochia californica TaxID=171875 RepID=UPI0035DA5728
MLHGFRHYLFSISTCRLLCQFSTAATQSCRLPKSHPSSCSDSSTSVDAFDLLLRQCTSVFQCGQIHAQTILTGTQNSPFLAAKLISFYSKFDRLSDAVTVFRTLSAHQISNVLSWNAILRANVSHGRFEDAFTLYLQMRKLGLAPDGFTFPLVIRACASTGKPKVCEVIHNHVCVMGFGLHLHVGNELIGMYSKLGHMKKAQLVFEKMLQRSVISWNTLVSGFAMNYNCESALEVFHQMETEGWVPNSVTWTSILSAHARCAEHDKVIEMFSEMCVRGVSVTAESIAVVISVCSELGQLEKGKTIHGYITRKGYNDYSFVKNSLICMYGKTAQWVDMNRVFSELKVKNLVSWNALISSYAGAGLCDEAFDVFSQLKKKMGGDFYIRPNVISWSAVIGGFASSGHIKKCLELFHHMLHDGVEPNAVTIASVLSMSADFAELSLGKEIHGYVVRALMDKHILVENGLIHMYTKCGNLHNAEIVFDRMVDRDLISWNSMVAAYGMHGFAEKAVKTFMEMVAGGLKPDRITFVALLSACSHAGLVNKGRFFFNQMISEFKVVPQMEHYACLVDMLGRAGLIQEASELVKKMPMKPNAYIWGALLNACRIHRSMPIAEETASEIFNLNLDLPGSYMLISNLYAACGRWDDSARVRVLAKTKGLKKSPGHSWIEVKKKIYRFSAWNALEPGFEDIYDLLWDLGLHMEAEGYVLDKSFMLQDICEGADMPHM